MKNLRRITKLKSKKLKVTLIILIFFSIVFFNAESLFSPTHLIQNKNNNPEDITLNDLDIKLSDGEDFLFQGIEDSLVINDTGNLYDLNQEI
ncbi:MAG: hypothetical protein ACFFB9_14460, partial [Promethearchaeota archaeon]